MDRQLTQDLNKYVFKSEDCIDYSVKDTKGKPRLALVPPILIRAVGEVMTFGIDKYYEDSWKSVKPYEWRDALVRHLVDYLENPQGVDEESGLPHLYHIACNVAYLLYQQDKGGY